MKIQCTAYLWPNGYVMVDGNKRVDNVPDQDPGDFDKAVKVRLYVDVPDSLFDNPPLPKIKAQGVQYADQTRES